MLRQPFKKEVNEIISDKRFMLCGTSFVVNLHQIKSIRDEELYFKRGQVVTPPRKYYNEIKNTWLDYWFENTI